MKLDFQKLRAITDAAKGKQNYKQTEQRFNRINSLKEKLQTHRKRLEVSTVVTTLPLRAQIAALSGEDCVEVLKLEMLRHYRFEPGNPTPEQLVGVASQLFKELQKQGYAPALKFFPSTSWYDADHGHGHWSIIVNW